jgi:TMEM175 potassium channel family protein
MTKGRLEAFSDGVIAILITIMVLELKVPHGADVEALRSIVPVFLAYVLSFVFVGIYWNNHHHLLQLCTRVDGRVLWANLHLLFWLSLVPVATAWMGHYPSEPLPTALYGIVLMFAGFAYLILQGAIVAAEGADSKLRAAVGRDFKGKLSVVLYLAAIAAAFVHEPTADVIYVVVALMWLVPDRRIERAFGE